MSIERVIPRGIEVEAVALGAIATGWGDATFREYEDGLISNLCRRLDQGHKYPFWTLQTHVARTSEDQKGIDLLGGVLGVIEPRLEYGADAAMEMQIALGLVYPTPRYYARTSSGLVNVYLTPFTKNSAYHDELAKPTGELVVDPKRIVEELGANHQLLREDRTWDEDVVVAAGRLRQLSNQWRIAVI